MKINKILKIIARFKKSNNFNKSILNINKIYKIPKIHIEIKIIYKQCLQSEKAIMEITAIENFPLLLNNSNSSKIKAVIVIKLFNSSNNSNSKLMKAQNINQIIVVILMIKAKKMNYKKQINKKNNDIFLCIM